ncbi:MAG TPA: hypothetical protein VK141_08040 [Nitrosomonas sp.]|nr:hypothetical protein [Nitrosomonas sp.]
MLREGWRLDYQTPIGGYPWSIPFEFPIYQSIVALIAYLGNFPLDPVGRFVSLLFLFASALPAFGISRRLSLPPEVPWVFSALLWSSPIYLFWGRTFMIETAATFFTFAAIPYAIDLIDQRPQLRSVFMFLLWMTLGMLQKITTALPVMIVLSLLIAILHFKNFGLRLFSWQKLIRVLVAFGVPVIIAGLWSYYADIVRQHNILGLEMTSKKLIAWNFGTINQRLDFEIIRAIIWDSVFVRNLGGMAGLLILGTALFLGQRRTKTILLISLILFLLPIEMFINLNIIHDYYQTSSALFIIGGLSIAIVDLLQKIKMQKSMTILTMTLVFVLLNLNSYKETYWVLIDNLSNSLNKSANQTLLISNILARYTPPDSAIVIFGMDWDSEIAYYSGRKSFTVPSWVDKQDWKETYSKIWQDPQPYLGGMALSAIVFCEDPDRDFGTKAILDNQFVGRQPKLFKVSDCYIWLPGVDKIVLPTTNQIILPTDY